MKKNVGKVDRSVRIAIGVAGLVLGYIVSPWFYILAAIGFVTGALGMCGLYKLVGVNTCPVESIGEDKASEAK